MPRSPVRTRSRTAQVLAGAAATALLIVLVAGIPVVLLRLSPHLAPHHVPSIGSIRTSLLARDDSGALFIRAIALLGWLGWLSFAISVIAELIGRIRGRSTVRLPGLGAQQRWAGALIAAVVLMFASPAIAAPAAVMHAKPPVAAVASAAEMRPAVSLSTPYGVSGAAGRELASSAPVVHNLADALTYDVHRGDYLGVIAERFEGDFGAYKQIALTNHIDNPDMIRPGWTLTLPSNARDQGSMPHARGTIRADSTSTGGAAASDAAPPDSATSHPASTHGAPTHAPPTDHATPPSTVPHSVHPVTHAMPQPAQAPTPVRAPAPAPHGPSASPHPQQSGARRSPVPAVPADSGSSTSVSDLLAASGTLAAVVSLSLFAVQKRELLQRRLVKRMPGPASGGALPRLMVPTRQQDVIRLDASLRALAAIVDGWPVERIPQIAGVWMDFATMTLLLADDCGAAPAPFVDDPNGWQLPVGPRLPVFESQLAPLPTMCTVGGRANQHLLLDIEYLRMLGIGGDSIEAVNLLRFIAVELSHNIWSDDVRVVLAGFGDEASALAAIDPDRMRVQPSIPEAIERFRARVARAVAAWDGPAEAPEVLLIANPTDFMVEDLVALERDLMCAPGLGLAVVVAPTPDGFLADRYQVEVDRDGQLHVGFLGDAIMPAASLPALLVPEVGRLIDAARDAGDTSPLDLARAASRAVVQGGRLRRTVAMAGQHRRPPGQPPETREARVDLMKARHVRSA